MTRIKLRYVGILLTLVVLAVCFWIFIDGRASKDQGHTSGKRRASDLTISAGTDRQEQQFTEPDNATVPVDDIPEIGVNTTVRIADKEYALLFETAAISPELKKTIVADVELNLSHLKQISCRSISQSPTEPCQMYDKKVTHWLDEGRQRRYFPKQLERYFGGVVSTNNSYQIVIHKQLIKEYEKAMLFKKEHAEMLDRMDAFVDSLGDQEEIEDTEDGAQIAKDMFLFDGSAPQEYAYVRQLNGFKKMNIRKPSVFDFRTIKYRGKEMFVCSTLITSPEDAKRKFVTKGPPLFAYMDGEWLIYLPRTL